MWRQLARKAGRRSYGRSVGNPGFDTVHPSVFGISAGCALTLPSEPRSAYTLATESLDDMKDVPFMSSGYKLYGHFCGMFVPFLGKAPGIASDTWWLPKPNWYSGCPSLGGRGDARTCGSWRYMTDDADGVTVVEAEKGGRGMLIEAAAARLGQTRQWQHDRPGADMGADLVRYV